MKSLFVVTMLAAAALVGLACGSGSNKATSSSTPAATVAATATSAPTLAAQAATPATNPNERVNGTVQAVDGNKVTLKEGGSFSLSPQTMITHRVPAKADALQVGKAVAVTAKQQPDNTLLASAITVFPAAPSQTFFRQFPMGDGNLMTNATIDKMSGNSFSVTFPGGGGQVTMAPDVQITTIGSGTPSDITVGAMVSATVSNGVAQSVTIL